MQSGLNLCCSQTSEDRFSRIKDHILITELIYQKTEMCANVFSFIFCYVAIVSQAKHKVYWYLAIGDIIYKILYMYQYSILKWVFICDYCI